MCGTHCVDAVSSALPIVIVLLAHFATQYENELHITGVNHVMTGMGEIHTITVYETSTKKALSVYTPNNLTFHKVYCYSQTETTPDCQVIPKNVFFVERIYLNPYTDTAPLIDQIIPAKLYLK